MNADQISGNLLSDLRLSAFIRSSFNALYVIGHGEDAMDQSGIDFALF
jgi:hypothetical protein